MSTKQIVALFMVVFAGALAALLVWILIVKNQLSESTGGGILTTLSSL